MFAEIDSETSWSWKQKYTVLVRLNVGINMESTMKAVLQRGAVFAAYINTRFQITGYLDFDRSPYEQTIVRLDKTKEKWDRITCPRQFRIFINERCNL